MVVAVIVLVVALYEPATVTVNPLDKLANVDTFPPICTVVAVLVETFTLPAAVVSVKVPAVALKLLTTPETVLVVVFWVGLGVLVWSITVFAWIFIPVVIFPLTVMLSPTLTSASPEGMLAPVVLTVQVPPQLVTETVEPETAETVPLKCTLPEWVMFKLILVVGFSRANTFAFANTKPDKTKVPVNAIAVNVLNSLFMFLFFYSLLFLLDEGDQPSLLLI